MKEIEKEMYELTKTEYERLKEKSELGQNNNGRDRVYSVHLIRRKDNKMDMIEYDLSLYSGSKPSYILYKNVNPKYIEEVSGILFAEFRLVN